MQITKAEVTPIELKLKRPVQMAGLPLITHITAIFVRLETRQGNTYSILIDRQGGECTLTIVQVPRQIGVDAPDYQDSFPDYESAEKALRDFLRTH